MKIIRIGVDLAKSVIALHGVDEQGRVQLCKTVKANKLLELLRALEPCLVAMEACSMAHWWARQIEALKHSVKLLPAQYVRAYRIGGKNDGNDAAAICEAAGRASLPTVAIKSAAQLELQALHRVRSQAVAARSAKANQMRALMMEQGVVCAKGLRALRAFVPAYRADESMPGSAFFKSLIGELMQELRQLDERIGQHTLLLTRFARADATCRRLMSVPGIGAIVATALVCAFGDVSAFSRARAFAAALGLAQRQASSGGKQRLGAITRAGNCYLRALLVHGARAVVRAATRPQAARNDSLYRWIAQLAQRTHTNVVVVATANKLARIAWVIMTQESSVYLAQRPQPGR